MPRIALATSHELADLWAGDRLFLAELRRRGHDAYPAVWNDPASAWARADAVIIRSCWDYHLKAEAFRAWLHRAASDGRILLNPADVVRWNMHKGYLLDVERAGGRIPPTRVIPKGDSGRLADHLRSAGWDGAVIKPAISATGHNTRLVRGAPAADDERVFAEALAEGDVLAQAYVPEVREHGEWSLVFFGGRYSHAALKRAAPGEFRVHIEWGGTVETAAPPPPLVEQAQALMDALALGAVYSRVDGTQVNGELMIMELEAIEPELFFDCEPAAAGRLAEAVEGVLAAHGVIVPNS